jgi:hypothetical protein
VHLSAMGEVSHKQIFVDKPGADFFDSWKRRRIHMPSGSRDDPRAPIKMAFFTVNFSVTGA